MWSHKVRDNKSSFNLRITRREKMKHTISLTDEILPHTFNIFTIRQVLSENVFDGMAYLKRKTVEQKAACRVI